MKIYVLADDIENKFTFCQSSAPTFSCMVMLLMIARAYNYVYMVAREGGRGSKLQQTNKTDRASVATAQSSTAVNEVKGSRKNSLLL